jgi:hypothetical protein
LRAYYNQEITDPNISYMKYFSIFLSICNNMRANHKEMTPQAFRR